LILNVAFIIDRDMSFLVRSSVVGLALVAALGACGEAAAPTVAASTVPAKDRPIDGLTSAELATFQRGNQLFDLALREGDGLGPLYTRNNCSACHDGALRGPGAVEKMSVVTADGVTPAADQSRLAFGPTVHPLLAAGATEPIVPPEGDPSVRVSRRVGPPVVGRGAMEAVRDDEILRMEAEQAARTDGIHGRVNHVVYASEANPDTRYHTHQKGDLVIGRFGLKARIATLDDFTADAAQGDMGMTSPLRPTEFENPDGLTDDRKPGIDLGIDSINQRADYVRMLAIPRVGEPSAKGRKLFEEALCSVCHAPSLATRSDYPIAPLAGTEVAVFTDLLLHDMGQSLSDSLEGADGDAHAREWRTAPLIGMSLFTTFLHDGRASSIDEAIRLHDGEGKGAADLYRAMTADDARALVAFVQSL
jgi:CxxC motif-containing protein (DUF1111 family)